jgi:hypothetical protein
MHPVSLGQGADLLAKHILVERLDDPVFGAELQRGDRRNAAVDAGQEDDLGPLAPYLPQALEDLPAMDAGHEHVEKHDVDATSLNLEHRFVAIEGGDDVVVGLQDEPQGVVDAFVIVHDHHDRLRGRATVHRRSVFYQVRAQVRSRGNPYAVSNRRAATGAAPVSYRE